jgi:hypothetical protein
MDGYVPVNRRPRVRTFYESFVNTVYGFVLVLGFQQFVKLPSQHLSVTVVLLVAAYVTVLHYWLVFVASTEDTFVLILASTGDTARMGSFWIELVFATAMIVPMLQLFESLTNVAMFARVMLLIALLSFAWDIWAFVLSRHQHMSGIMKRSATESEASTAVLLLRWIGLDVLFVVIMLLVVGIITQRGADRTLVAWSLLAVTGIGAILDTLVIAPSLFLRSDPESSGLSPPPVINALP